MLQIRAEQMRVLQHGIDAELVRAIRNHLHAHHRSDISGIPETVLEERIAASIALAHEYALTSGTSVAAFVVLRFTTAPDYHLHPQIRDVLREHSVADDARIARLGNLDAWCEVMHRRADAAW